MFSKTIKLHDQSEADQLKSLIHKLKFETGLTNEGAVILTALNYYKESIEGSF
jgi:hypothetical protein